MNDFRVIKYGKQTLNSELFNNEHLRCLEFIKKSLKESKAKTKIVVTHHVPSDLLTAEEFKGDQVSDAFTVDLTEYIKNCGAQFWIFGHSHRNINQIIGNTSCLCNQVGYVMVGENITFENDKNIEIK